MRRHIVGSIIDAVGTYTYLSRSSGAEAPANTTRSSRCGAAVGRHLHTCASQSYAEVTDAASPRREDALKVACLQDGLIAINYAARALGISRHMRVQEAMRKCPELQCIHVQTLGQFCSVRMPRGIKT